MRIRHIRFKNLNSLVGEWEVDLTHPAFSSDGIFAITGPTGAGKTTLLDAICLALYGRTPRLNRVTKSGNEVMSRQTGECFAEVTFETPAGRFRSHWSQHRARRKPGGELQAPRHEIVDAVSGRIFETKLRGVADEIETVTGMDFERFTRSMLLAQGDFAAFLQAAPDERAPILEQITGTEIYSRISIRVHEKYAAERKKLDALLALLEGIQVFGEEDEHTLKSSLSEKILLETELENQLKQGNEAIGWLEGIGILEKEIASLEVEKRDLYSRKNAFEPELRKLGRAKQALELAADHAGLVSLRREQDTDHLRLSQCRRKLPELETGAKEAEQVSSRATIHLAQQKNDQRQAAGGIRKVRELDSRLKEKETPIKAAGEALSRTGEDIDALRLKQAAGCRLLDEKRRNLDAVQQFLTENGPDAGLVEQLAAIRGRLETFRDIDGEYRSKMEELAGCEKKMSEALRLWEKQSATLETLKNDLSGIENRFEDRQRSLKEISAGREIADWRDALVVLKDRKTFLQQVIEAAASLAEAQRMKKELMIREDGLRSEKETLEFAIREQTRQQSELERQIPLLETKLSLLQKIQDFETARHQLRDGAPCPLCGATAHPYAEGNVPVPDETTESLVSLKAALKKAGKILSGLMVKEANILKDLEQTELQQIKCAEDMATAESRISKGLSALSVDPSGRSHSEILERERQENEANLQKALSVVQSSEKLEREIAGIRGALEKMRATLARSEQDTLEAVHRKESAQRAFDRAEKESLSFAGRFRKVKDETLRELSPYGIETLSVQLLNEVLEELIARRDRWQDRRRRKTELDNEISALSIETQHQGEEIRKLEAARKEKQEALDTLLGDAAALSGERRRLFGDKDPDMEEERLAAAVEDADKRMEHTRQMLSAANQELATLRHQIAALEQAIEIRSIQLKTTETAFLELAAKNGFSEEADYLSACLTEEERVELSRWADTLATAEAGLEARYRDKAAQLETERKKGVTEKPIGILTEEKAALLASLKELQQALGGIRQKLHDIEFLRLQRRDLSKRIDSQKKECSRWETLHALIGSADGKKYRIFAQGLTFEIMIGHANRRLQQMTDRYLLVRDEVQPLELNVVDNYQAGEIRSTKNLSGGESFIVSLSLALGLSCMAGKNVRVDSLFLDEGFGTLDEEALETALETLAGLRRDGKLIGVISHVSALKERIGTRIQIIPLTGGRSIIVGPGCGHPEEIHRQ